MKITILGGSGYIGSYVAEYFAHKGHQVKILTRNNCKTNFIESLGAKAEVIDYLSIDNLSHQMNDSDCIINCTANPKIYLPLKEMRKVEVEVTKNILRALVTTNVKKFIQLSSIVANGYSHTGPFAEPEIPKVTYNYPRVSLEREQLVMDYIKHTSIKAYILRPASALGKRAPSAAFFSKIYSLYRQNKFPYFNKGENVFSIIDIRDIGPAMEILLSKDNLPSDTFLVKGHDISWKELKHEIDLITGNNARPQLLNKTMLKTLAFVSEKLTPGLKEPLITRMAIDALSTNFVANDSKIRSLGYKPAYSLRDTLSYAIEDLL